MIKLTNAIINSTNELSSGTYVVEDTIELSHDLTISNDVTLIFQGGKFETNVANGITINGTNTRVEAPICTIFGKGIKVEGSWDIDRAYPQWFKTVDVSDWGILINNAIKMKQVGEVFLKNGEYVVETPIIMNCRIHLIGESSQYKDVDKNGNESYAVGYTKLCTPKIERKIQINI